MSKKVGRNQPCPCGSGKKYKHCCWGTDAHSDTRKRNMYLLIGALAVGSVIAYVVLTDDAAPPGKVWSEEHGHWHDASGTEPFTLPDVQALGDSLQPTPFTPQQPDSTPPGKVWSPEHGHWHDAPASDSF